MGGGGHGRAGKLHHNANSTLPTFDVRLYLGETVMKGA